MSTCGCADHLDPSVEAVPPLGATNAPGNGVGHPQERFAALSRFEAVRHVGPPQDAGQDPSVTTLLVVVDVIEDNSVESTGQKMFHELGQGIRTLVNRSAVPCDGTDTARGAW